MLQQMSVPEHCQHGLPQQVIFLTAIYQYHFWIMAASSSFWYTEVWWTSVLPPLVSTHVKRLILRVTGVLWKAIKGHYHAFGRYASKIVFFLTRYFLIHIFSWKTTAFWSLNSKSSGFMCEHWSCFRSWPFWCIEFWWEKRCNNIVRVTPWPYHYPPFFLRPW